jgi:hypothetical protein
MTPPKLHHASWIKSPKTYHIDDEALPQLVLYLTPEEKVTLKNPEEWTNLYHQTGGYACTHQLLKAKFLKLKPQYEEFFKKLNKDYVDSLIMSPPNFNDAKTYQEKLESVGLSANHTYTQLEEGFYPIDIEYLQEITSELLPQNLDELKRPDTTKRFPIPTFWKCAVLGLNCD